MATRISDPGKVGTAGTPAEESSFASLYGKVDRRGPQSEKWGPGFGINPETGEFNSYDDAAGIGGKFEDAIINPEGDLGGIEKKPPRESFIARATLMADAEQKQDGEDGLTGMAPSLYQKSENPDVEDGKVLSGQTRNDYAEFINGSPAPKKTRGKNP